MRWFCNILGLLCSVGYSFSCVRSAGEDPLTALLSSPPVIQSITPQIGSPAQNNLNGIYAATDVIIRGENFGTDPVVRFNNIQATIKLNTGVEIYTSVPNGAASGIISISKSGGSCLPNAKEGINCTGLEFFIDCYSVKRNEYGPELELKQGNSLSVAFSGTTTKAFRTDTLLGSRNLTITCESNVTVRVFDQNCSATDYILVKDPTIALPAGLATQFYTTAGSATCKFSL